MGKNNRYYQQPQQANKVAIPENLEKASTEIVDEKVAKPSAEVKEELPVVVEPSTEVETPVAQDVIASEQVVELAEKPIEVDPALLASITPTTVEPTPTPVVEDKPVETTTPTSAQKEINYQIKLNSLSPLSKQALHYVGEYVKHMGSNRPTTLKDILHQQRSLFNALNSIINLVPLKDFNTTFTELLAIYAKNETGCFDATHLLRGMDNVEMDADKREAFMRWNDMLTMLAKPATRAILKKQVDLTRALKVKTTDQGRQRVINYFS